MPFELNFQVRMSQKDIMFSKNKRQKESDLSVAFFYGETSHTA